MYSTQFHEYVSDLPPPGRILVAIQQQLVSLFRKAPIYQRKKLEPRLACNAIFHELKFQNSAKLESKAGELPRKLVEFTILIGLSRRGSPTGGSYSFVSFRKVPYAYNISARNRHPHVTIHKPSLLHAYICVSMEPNSHITRLIAIFRSQETRKEETRHQTHESSTGKTCRWQWCNLPRNSLGKDANYRCVIRSSWLPPLPVMEIFWNRIHTVEPKPVNKHVPQVAVILSTNQLK